MSLSPDGADEPLGVTIHLRAARQSPRDLSTGVSADSVERRGAEVRLNPAGRTWLPRYTADRRTTFAPGSKWGAEMLAERLQRASLNIKALT